MNILKRYTTRVARVVFCNKQHSEADLSNQPRYCFHLEGNVPKLKRGDYVVVKTQHGLSIAVFMGYSKSKRDIQIATAPLLGKVGDLTIYNYNEF